MNSHKFIRLIAISLLIICASACRAQKSSTKTIDAEVQTISLPAFDAIQNQSAVRLHITQGDRQSVRVKQARAGDSSYLSSAILSYLRHKDIQANKNPPKYGLQYPH